MGIGKGRSVLVSILILCFLTVLTGCGGGSQKNPVPVLKKIEIQPGTSNVPVNGTCKFTAVGKDQNGKTMSIKPTWKVKGEIGAVSPLSGATTTFTANAAGTGTITANVGNIIGSAQIVVSQEPPVLTGIEVSPASITVVDGETKEFTATGRDQYGAVIALPETPVWEVTGGIGTVAPINGVTTTFTATSLGDGTVQATVGSLEGAAQVTVVEPQASPELTRIEISPSTSIFTEGEEKGFSATGYDQYDNQIVITPAWSVSGVSGSFSPAVGAATTFVATTDGIGTIKATEGSITGSASITVNEVRRLDQIIISPDSATINEGENMDFYADGYDQYGDSFSINPTWSVTGGIGTVSPGSGTFATFTATNAGNGTITATEGSVSGAANVTVNSTTIRVPHDYGSIQAAVDAAVDGTTIIVDEGVYHECVVIDSKNITLKSTNPDSPMVVENTIINGGGNGSTVLITGSSLHTVTVEGITVTGGNGSDLVSGSLHYGGGVYAYIATTILRKNTICNNTAHNGGGGIYGYMGDLILEENIIENNSSYVEGGGLYLTAAFGNTIQVTMANNIIRNNSSTDRNGGGIHTWNVDGVWSGNIIEGNSADTYAGGICLNYSSPVITNNQIIDNTAEESYGGISVDANSFPVIQNNTISGNQAFSINGYGGGVCIASSGLVLSDNTISNNSASYGGGIYSTGNLTLTDNIISGNNATSSGGGIFAQNDITLTNNNFWSNIAGLQGGGVCLYAAEKRLTASGNDFSNNQEYAIILYPGAVWDDQGGNTFSGNTPSDIYQ